MRPRVAGRSALVGLLLALFATTQVAALAHEVEHLFRQHLAPCALHDAAEHLVVVSPLPPETVAALERHAGVAPPYVPAAPERPARPRVARAPPPLA
jgi:hypothetical protein